MARSEQETIELLRELGVLEDINPTLLSDGVLVGCGDCDRSPELLNFYRGQLEKKNGKARLHLIMVNGGPLRLVHKEKGEDSVTIQEFLMNQIEGSLALKKLNRVILLGHGPCGQAGLWGMNIEKTIAAFFEARDKVLARVKCEVVVPVHIDYDGKKMKTYHVDYPKWVAWQELKKE